MMHPDRLKIVIVGHVDHGKSTLIGRLLFDTDSIPETKKESMRQAAEAEGMDFEYAFLLDALLEEQEQNITIDTTQIQFRTAKREYVIIDAPGHKEFLKNMITGAASASGAILLIDAKEGVQEQSRRHGFLLSLLGVKQVIVAVNKMDLVDFSQARFEEIERGYREFLEPLGVIPKYFIPISAKHGHNITTSSGKMPWSAAPPILTALDSFTPPASQSELPLRLCVQDVYRFDDRRIVAGRIEAGRLRVGDEIAFWPERKTSRIRSIENWPNAGTVLESVAGESTAITLEEQIFVERGQIGSHLEHPPVESRQVRARMFWLHDQPLMLNQLYTLKLATQTVEVRVKQIERIIDSSSLQVIDQPRAEIRKNEVAEVTLQSRRPLAFDNQAQVNETGRFVLLQGSRIGGGGVIFGAEEAAQVKSGHITWSEGEVTPSLRARHFGHRGGVVWLTGLSGSGKSTLAIALEKALLLRGVASFVLDGDNLRHGLCSDLGFSDDDRAENIRRASEVARLMGESGIVVITALISPFRVERARARETAEAAGLPFLEVFVNASLESCQKRDPKGLYGKVAAGEIRNFTGIDSPYEAPAAPDLELSTDQQSKEQSLEILLSRVLLACQSISEVSSQTPGEGI